MSRKKHDGEVPEDRVVQSQVLSRQVAGPYASKQLALTHEFFPIGFGLAMSRSCLTNIVFFSSFEFIKKKINQLPDSVLLDPVD